LSVRVEVVDGAITQELRRAVLRPNWPVGAAMHGDDNPDAVYIGALDDAGRLLGTCLVMPQPYPPHPDRAHAWRLRGMATDAQLRSRGIGAAVLAKAMEEIRSRGGRLVWCDARTSAVAFYRRHGFATEGPEFMHEESGLPHYRMWRELSK
jgi:GNAT superfamily N-acetyltransferase